jgi:hypothetical protein
MFKKRIIVICMLAVSLILFTSCVDDHIHKYIDGICTCGEIDPNYQKINCALDRDAEECLDPNTWGWDYNKNNWDGKGMTIEIAVDKLSLHDPFDENYKGDRKIERQSLITKIESEYNIDIIYRRHTGVYSGIFKEIKNGMSNIFLIDSSYIPGLKNNNLITELYNIDSKSGIFTEYNYVQDEKYNLMSTVNNKVYGYKNGSVYIDHFLYYNQDLINKYDLPDPAKLWNEGKWTWSAFIELLAQAQNIFDTYEGKNSIYAFNGEYFEVAKGLVAARGGQFVENNKVLLDDEIVVGVYEDLREIEQLYWLPRGSTVAMSPFPNEWSLFETGKLDYIDGNSWREIGVDFSISVVPYPRMDEDPELKSYKVPFSNEQMYVIPNCETLENGLTPSILFNILDDINNGLIPEEKTTNSNYRDYLEEKIDSKDSVEAIFNISVNHPEAAYFEMIDIISITMGEGSHYAINGIYPKSAIIIAREKSIVKDILGELQLIYQKQLDEMLDNK